MLLSQLKVATRSEHARLEGALDLLRPGLSLDDYRRLLARLHGFYAPWEDRMAVHAGRMPPGFFAERGKARLLEQDLRDLGRDAATPTCRDLPDVSGWPAALGSMYVVEGSTLGGQYITQHLSRRFGFVPPERCAFFHSYGERVGPMWQEFRAFLTTHSTPATDDGIIQAAGATFRKLHAWMTAPEAAG